MRQIILSGALLLAGIVNAVAADTYIFKDVQRPHGRDRSMPVKIADAAKCGWKPDGRVVVSEKQMERCMLSFGWAVSQHIPDPAGTPDNSVEFTDLSRGGTRGEEALQADKARCDPHGKLDAMSRQYQQCMLGRGRHFWVQTAPAAQPSSTDADDVAAEAAAEESRDDDLRRSQQQIEDMINTQNMINNTQDMINTQNMVNTQNMIDTQNMINSQNMMNNQ